MQVEVLLRVPDYVPPGYRSKVTVVARPLAGRGDTEPSTANTAFYFTVVPPGNTLAVFDTTPPSCQVIPREKFECEVIMGNQNYLFPNFFTDYNPV